MSQGKEPVIERIGMLTKRYPSRSAAARAWGININTLNSYFKGGQTQPAPRESILIRISESEGVSLEWLKEGKGELPNDTGIYGNFGCSGDKGDQLTQMLSFLTKDEREQLTNLLARKGVETVLTLLNKENQDLLQLEGRKRLAALMIVDMPDDCVREILEKTETSRQSNPVESKAG
ncbi:hypothetical protein ABMJ88_003197 [Escherichia coli]